MMRAATYSRTGPAETVLRVGHQPRPLVGPNEVLVRIHASGINPADVKRRAGWNGAQIVHDVIIPHCDGAGVIEAVGAAVAPDRVGTRVWLWNAQGGYGETGRAFGTAADYVALPSDQAVPLPHALSFDEGACLGVPAVTAWFAVCGTGPVDDLTVMVHGAAGAVGLAATQIALAERAKVIAIVSARGAEVLARELGPSSALTVIDRHAIDIPAQVRAANGGRGVDRIVEVDLAANLATDVACLAPHGIVASYSCSSDPAPTLPYYTFADLGAQIRFIQGFLLPPGARAAAFSNIARLATIGLLRPYITARFPLDAIAAAHDRVASGAPGQTILTFE
jgi:NADPH2:quinone reductase